MTTVEHARRRSRSSRATVGRDTMVILAGALLAVMAGNLAGFGGLVGDLASPTPEDTSTIIGGGSLPPRATFPPVDTLGPIVNPTIGFQATPTPIPIITLGPPTPTPSASPSVGPSTKPSIKPSAKPSAAPTLTPKPSAAFTCVVDALTVNCTVTSVLNATSWDWDWGDSTANGSGPSAQHMYIVANTYKISLTASGPGGVAISSQDVTVVEPTPTP